MCAIFGALLSSATPMTVARANEHINHIMLASQERGRDGWGYHVGESPNKTTGGNYERRSVVRNSLWPDTEFFNPFQVQIAAHMIGNMRAEPTTEFVEDKHEFDQQPYRAGKWTIVHNGTIANDHHLRNNFEGQKLPTGIDSAAIAEYLDYLSEMDPTAGPDTIFKRMVADIKGSYAILATHDDHRGEVLVACNYRPVWFAQHKDGTFFASARDYFPEGMVPQMVEPYSMWAFSADGRSRLDNAAERPGRALAVCSGGMDSVVATVAMIEAGYDVHMLHFQYGSRAEGPEHAAILAIAAQLNIPLHTIPMNIYSASDSPLLQHDSQIAGGEAGAEFAHEWVPARNLVMLALATAYAEANGFETLVLGNNLEEAGAYPDNEPEFINRFNDLLPFAVGDGKRVRVVMPVGNMMKHEIVALGEQLGAPMGLTWSCYRSGPIHCGTCGPCFMRRTAYKINRLKDPLLYAKDA